MATRRPLVRDPIDGRLQELPAGDSLPGAGGAAVIESAALTVPNVVNGYTEIVFARVGTLPGQRVIAQMAGGIDQHNDVEELADSAMRVDAVAETDQVRFILQSQNFSRFVGPYTVNFQVSA